VALMRLLLQGHCLLLQQLLQLHLLALHLVMLRPAHQAHQLLLLQPVLQRLLLLLVLLLLEAEGCLCACAVRLLHCGHRRQQQLLLLLLGAIQVLGQDAH
jgi:hypothetical protein